MNSQLETTAAEAAEEWLNSLPAKVRARTISTQILKEHLIADSPRQVAISLANCIEQKAWEGIAYMPSVESKREVRQYTPVQWIRECLGVEPDELFRVLAGQQIPVENTAPAAAGMVKIMAAEEPETLRALCADFKVGSGTMLGWNNLIKQCGWGEAQAELQEAVKKSAGRPSGSSKTAKNNASHCDAISDPSLAENRKPTDRKSRMIRTLQRLANDSNACKERGTTKTQVVEALNGLVRGVIPTVAAAERAAGLAKTAKSAPAISVAGTPATFAKRLITKIGADNARAIANAVLEQLANND